MKSKFWFPVYAVFSVIMSIYRLENILGHNHLRHNQLKFAPPPKGGYQTSTDQFRLGCDLELSQPSLLSPRGHITLDPQGY